MKGLFGVCVEQAKAGGIYSPIHGAANDDVNEFDFSATPQFESKDCLLRACERSAADGFARIVCLGRKLFLVNSGKERSPEDSMVFCGISDR